MESAARVDGRRVSPAGRAQSGPRRVDQGLAVGPRPDRRHRAARRCLDVRRRFHQTHGRAAWRRGRRIAGTVDGFRRYARQHSDARRHRVAQCRGRGRGPVVRGATSAVSDRRATMSLFNDEPAPVDPKTIPLAERMRPRSLDEIVGQDDLVKPGRPLREMIDRDLLQSIILWGPPGTGKTTLARLIADLTRAEFLAFSAVLSGIKEVKDVMAAAEQRRRLTGKRTIVFVDEIHRFNKAQQDAFLPRVESGDIVLVGATTENPSFEVNAALLSRSKVFVLKPLDEDAIVSILKRALADNERGLGRDNPEADDDAMRAMARFANGDARAALNVLQLTVAAAPQPAGRPRIDRALLEKTLTNKALLYDKSGEEHYNLMSALHKSMRNSDADASIYWLARMLEAGEDPKYVARRLIRFASEDVGNADPQALAISVAAKDAVHFIGMPEGNTALAQAV